jgi:hypothetical protein
MVQYRQPLSKAFQSEISFAMQEKIKMGITVCFVHFFECWFLPVEVRFRKMLYNPIFPLWMGIILKLRWCWQGIWIHLLFSYPLFYKRNICRSFHFLFSGRHCLQEIDVTVEVRNPAGNFDTLGKIFVRGFWSTKSKIWFWHNIDTDFIHTVDFLQGCHLKKILRKTYFSWKPCRS